MGRFVASICEGPRAVASESLVATSGQEDTEHRELRGFSGFEEDGAFMGWLSGPGKGIAPSSGLFANEDGSLLLLFDGQIYNRDEIRHLFETDHTLDSGSAAELLVHLWEERGWKAVRSVRGEFAFALLDRGAERLYAGRDYVGTKSLYMARSGNRTLLSRELKDLPASQRGLARAVNPNTIVVGDEVKQLWLPPKEIRGRASSSIRKAIVSSVDVRWCGEEKHCLFLSGGIDSSIVALIAASGGKGTETFSVGVEGSKDLKAARGVARFIGSRHHEVVVTTRDVLECLESVIYHLETYDYVVVVNAIPSFLLARGAAQLGFRVGLGGDGADELFGGYAYLHMVPRRDFEKALWFAFECLSTAELLRVDRMSSPHGMQVRAPLLDRAVICTALGHPERAEPKAIGNYSISKYHLRHLFKDELPPAILMRKKSPIGQGTDFSSLLSRYAAGLYSDEDMIRSQWQFPDWTIRNKTELLFFEIWRRLFPTLASSDERDLASRGLMRRKLVL